MACAARPHQLGGAGGVAAPEAAVVPIGGAQAEMPGDAARRATPDTTGLKVVDTGTHDRRPGPSDQIEVAAVDGPCCEGAAGHHEPSEHQHHENARKPQRSHSSMYFARSFGT